MSDGPRREGGFEYLNEHEYTRIVRSPGSDHWHLETKLDCYGGSWQPVAASGRNLPAQVAALQVTIDIMLTEQRDRLMKELVAP